MKCPRCGGELEEYDEETMECRDCKAPWLKTWLQ